MICSVSLYESTFRVSCRLLGYLLISLIVVICPAVAGIADTGGTVAEIGRSRIETGDISFKIRIEQSYGNDRATEEVALISLINDAIEHETAFRHHILITQDELTAFSKYVDDNTKAPEILRKVKAVFNHDKVSYERIYLAPKIINRKLHSFYSTNPEIHKAERAHIERVFHHILSGKTFQEAAEECALTSSIFDIKDREISVHPELQKYVHQGEQSLKNPLIAILEKLQKGDVYKNIVEDDYRYRVIRLIEKKGDTYSVEAITVSKKPFPEWLKEENSKIKINILDTDLKKSITTRYQNVWWVRQLSISQN